MMLWRIYVLPISVVLFRSFSFPRFDCAMRVWDLGLLAGGIEPALLALEIGSVVLTTASPGSLIWLLFISAQAFSDSPCFFHQTLSALSAFYCASETHLLSLSV